MSKAKPKQLPRIPDNAEPVDISEASKRLGKGYSRRSIFRRIESGEWVEDLHWIDDCPQNSARRIIKINLTAINELRASPAAYDEIESYCKRRLPKIMSLAVKFNPFVKSANCPPLPNPLLLPFALKNRAPVLRTYVN